MSVIVDETTDHRDKSVLNVIDSSLLMDKMYLVDVVFMDKCNTTTVSQTVLKSLATIGIEYDNVCTFVTDNATYSKAGFRILKNVLTNAIHVGCMAHILNLVGEDLQKLSKHTDNSDAMSYYKKTKRILTRDRSEFFPTKSTITHPFEDWKTRPPK